MTLGVSRLMHLAHTRCKQNLLVTTVKFSDEAAIMLGRRERGPRDEAGWDHCTCLSSATHLMFGEIDGEERERLFQSKVTGY
jgi:hypothetical protein